MLAGPPGLLPALQPSTLSRCGSVRTPYRLTATGPSVVLKERYSQRMARPPKDDDATQGTPLLGCHNDGSARSPISHDHGGSSTVPLRATGFEDHGSQERHIRVHKNHPARFVVRGNTIGVRLTPRPSPRPTALSIPRGRLTDGRLKGGTDPCPAASRA